MRAILRSTVIVVMLSATGALGDLRDGVAVIKADGFLGPEVGLVLIQPEYTEFMTRPNRKIGNVEPVRVRVIQPVRAGLRGGIAVIETDIWDQGDDASADGFRDAAIERQSLPGNGEAFCKELIAKCDDIRLTHAPLRSPFNTGQIVVIYLPDSNGRIKGDPNEVDDSILYVGLDIANRDAWRVSAGGRERFMDVRLLEGKTWLQNGLPIIWPNWPNDPNVFRFPVMVPFDADGDGRTTAPDLDPNDPNRIGDRGTTRFRVPGLNLLSKFKDLHSTSEAYYFEFTHCATLPPNDIGLPVFDSFTAQAKLVQNFVFPEELEVQLVPSVLPKTLETSPPYDFDPDPSDPNKTVFTWIDGRGEDGQDNDDVEFLVGGFDSWMTGILKKPYEQVRFMLAQGLVQTTSDSTDEGSADDFVYAAWFLPMPQIEVKKEVRCVNTADPNDPNDPNRPWFDTRTALPADPNEWTVEFRVTVENTGNVPLKVTLTDVLQKLGAAGYVVDGNYVKGTFFGYRRDPNCQADPNVGVPITVFNAPCFGLSGLFFDEGEPDDNFAGGVATGQPRYLGCLQPTQVCPAYIPGDKVVIVVRARLTGCEKDPRNSPEIKNLITAKGEWGCVTDPNDPNYIPPFDPVFDNPDPSGPRGTDPRFVDTPREKNELKYDDNVVTVDLLCRDIDFLKEVQYVPDCNKPDPNAPWFDRVSIPPITEPGQTRCVRFRYTAFNFGEVDENVTVRDPDLCNDVKDPNLLGGVELIDCEVCPLQGPVTKLIKKTTDPNKPNTAFWYCTLKFKTKEALERFLKLDNNRRCDPNDPNLPDGSLSDLCYSNCGRATAVAVPDPEVCDSAPQLGPIYDWATFCTRCCYVDVQKEAACVYPDGTVGPYDPNGIDVLPGARVRFRVNTVNIGQDPNDTICRLRISDLLKRADGTPVEPNCATLVPNSVKFWRLPANTPCPVPGAFNIKNVPFEFDPSTCGGVLQPNEAIRFEFDVDIDPDADPNACDLTNTATIECAAECFPQPSYCNVDTDEARVNIRSASLVCTKEWAARWDSNGNCVIDPNDAFIAYSPNLKLDDGVVFPVLLYLRVAAKNAGEVPLDVKATDADLCGAVDCANGIDPNVYINNPSNCDVCPPGKEKVRRIDPNQTVNFTCEVYVERAAGLRAMALNACDKGKDDKLFENTVTVRGAPSAGVICPPRVPKDATSECSATILPPEPCKISVQKFVRCAPDCNACPDWDPNDPNAWKKLQEAAPKSCVQWMIDIKNEGPKERVPLLEIKDGMVPNLGFRNLKAYLVDAGGAVTSVPTPAGFNVDGVPFDVRFSFDANAPWLEPGERYVLTFCATLSDADVKNVVEVRAFSEACKEKKGPWSFARDEANVRIVRASVACKKWLAVDYGADGTFDKPPVDPNDPSKGEDQLVIEPSDPGYKFPAIVRWYFQATNTSASVPLKDVKICDPKLVADARSVGLKFEGCALCDPNTDPNCGGDGCYEVGDLTPLESKFDWCAIRFEDPNQLTAFTNLGQGNCYVNRATVTGKGDYAARGICPPPDPNVSSFCQATLCSRVTKCPKVKVVATIVNENEIVFSGTERCIRVWDERLLSRFTMQMGPYKGNPPPNNFLRSAIQTDKGRARLNAMASSLCPDSIDAPIIGVVATLMTVNKDPNNAAIAGMNLHGSGYEKGELVVLDLGPAGSSSSPIREPDPRPNSESDVVRLGRNDGSGQHRIGDEGGGQLSVDDPNLGLVVSSTQKGSLLVYPKVELKFDSQGKLIQDTFITLNNDFGERLKVIAFFVNGEPDVIDPNDPNEPLICNVYRNNEFVITQNQPVYWSAFTGQPLGVSRFTVLGEPVPDHDPFNPGGTRLHGYILLWAVDADKREIRWNHLSGAATLVNYKFGEAWEYNAAAFRALAGQREGELLLPPYGTLKLDGKEYDWAPDRLLLDFYTVGGEIVSGPGKMLKILDTDLALWIANNNYVE